MYLNLLIIFLKYWAMTINNQVTVNNQPSDHAEFQPGVQRSMLGDQ